jgi:hypothetical protein
MMPLGDKVMCGGSMFEPDWPRLGTRAVVIARPRHGGLKHRDSFSALHAHLYG